MPSFHKLQRGTCLALFAISSVASFFNPHLIYIAGLSIIGVIAYDVICYLRARIEWVDHSAQIKQLEKTQNELVEKLQSIRDDASLGKLAETFRRK